MREILLENLIHKSAVIEEGAQIGKNVKIGPFCYIGKDVIIGDNTELKSHVVLEGHVNIGKDNIFYPFVSVNTPQVWYYENEPSKVVIGNNNMIREYVTIQHGTKEGGMVTKLGDHNLLMVGVHIAHDCILGDHIVMANNATLAGHVTVGDYVVMGGLSAVHQKVRIGQHAMIGGITGVVDDVVPYGTVTGDRARLESFNYRGIKRRGFGIDDIKTLRNLFEDLFNKESDKVFAEKVKEVKAAYHGQKTAEQVIEFIENRGKRSITLPKKNIS